MQHSSCVEDLSEQQLRSVFPAPRSNTLGKGRFQAFAGLLCAIGVVLIAPAGVSGDEPPMRKVIRVHKDDIESAALGMLVSGPDGILIILDVEVRVAVVRTEPGYLAFWSDFQDELVYVYARPLFASEDVGQAVLNLVRDFRLEVPELMEASPALARAIREARTAFVEHTPWEVATIGLIRTLIGEGDGASDFPSDPISGISPTSLPCCFMASTLPKAGKGQSLDDLIRRLQEANSLDKIPPCWGCFDCPEPQECKSWFMDCDACTCVAFDTHGACTSDNNACTSDVCHNGSCVHYYHDCGDGNPCTIDHCDSDGNCWYGQRCSRENDTACHWTRCEGGGCMTITNDCDDGNPCTNDLCAFDAGCYYTFKCGGGPNACVRRSCNPDGSCSYERVTCDEHDIACLDGDAYCDPDVGCVYDWKDDCPPQTCKVRSCVNGDCTYQPKDCDPDSGCMSGYCDPVTGGCIYEDDCVSTNACYDAVCIGDNCKLVWACDDGDDCTEDRCESVGAELFCMNVPKSGDCEETECQTGTCDADGQCVTTPINEDGYCESDGNLCTEGTCVNGSCNEEQKADGESCGSGRVCCNGSCCAMGTMCCGGEWCYPPENCCNNQFCMGECCDGVCCEGPRARAATASAAQRATPAVPGSAGHMNVAKASPAKRARRVVVGNVARRRSPPSQVLLGLRCAVRTVVALRG